ncbi:unnamed protein product, partial [Urochloa humidicola]
PATARRPAASGGGDDEGSEPLGRALGLPGEELRRTEQGHRMPCLSGLQLVLERQVELHPAMATPNRDSGMQQLVPIALPGKDSGSGTGKELVVVDPAGKGSGGVKLREDEEDLEVKLRRIMENVPVRVSNT